MAMNAFSALDLSDDEEEDVSQTRRTTSSRNVTTKVPSRPLGSTKSDNLPDPKSKSRSVKSEKSTNKQRGARGAGTTKKREFDRHVSGNGAKRGVKKGGAGAHNWGTEGVEGDASIMEGDDENAVEEAADEGPPGISYEEWQAAEKERLASSEAFKPLAKRTVKSDFAGAKVMKKGDGEAIFVAESKKSKKQKEVKQKNLFLGANITVKDSNADERPYERRRGGRGGDNGRRGGKGGSGRRGGRGGKAGGKVDLLDKKAFPALG